MVIGISFGYPQLAVAVYTEGKKWISRPSANCQLIIQLLSKNFVPFSSSTSFFFKNIFHVLELYDVRFFVFA
jgi:hypothetical protein